MFVFQHLKQILTQGYTIIDSYEVSIRHYYSTVLIKQKVNDSKQIFYYLMLAFLYIYYINFNKFYYEIY